MQAATQTKKPRNQAFFGCFRADIAYGNCIKDGMKIDPCMGSGHILVYAFDVLVQIYKSVGYNERDAAQSILENNLYGLDIDDRAAQLAYFAVMMKARQYDRRIFTRNIQPHVYAIVESNGIGKDALEYFCAGRPELTTAMETIVKELHDAKEYGSLLTVTPQDWGILYARLEEVEQDISMYKTAVLEQIKPLVQVAQVLAQKYHAVDTNPPYMGSSNMNGKLSQFIKDHYADYKSDFFSAFIVRASEMAKENGYCGFFTPYVWMFIQSYEKLRHFLCEQKTIETLIQFEYSAFEEATVPVCTFAFGNRHLNKKGCYFRLTEFRGGMEVQRQKTLEAIANHDCGYYYEADAANFSKIPGSPVAYWVGDQMLDIFQNKQLEQFAKPRQGMATSDNNRFLRLWHEVEQSKVNLYAQNANEAKLSGSKWFPYNKGGNYRKWYGNNYFLINWENDGYEVKELAVDLYKSVTRTIKNMQFYFNEGVTWTTLSSGSLSARWSPVGFLFDTKGSTCYFDDKEHIKYTLGFLNCKVVDSLLKVVAPTLDFNAGSLAKLPIVYKREKQVQIDYHVSNLIDNSRTDWDSFENSWDFQRHPLVRGLFTVEESYYAWQQECENRFQTLKANEEELNRIFIDIYGLQDELTPEEEDKDVTVRRIFDTKEDIPESMRGSSYALTKRDVIVSLISYAVGCMFGRYSLDMPGLAYAGGEWDDSKYTTFQPDKDAIIPICDDEYFDDDIVGRFVKFIEAVYGKETLEENLKFIADALGGTGTTREVIRKYFLNDFYADHLKTYQKRPIYWLFDSGRKNGFKALVYMHRYQSDLLARLRTDYVHEQQERYRTQLKHIGDAMDSASASERVKLAKQQKKLQEQALEIQKYEEKVHHLADQNIKIDLDDGVKVNYAKFEDVLAKIK